MQVIIDASTVTVRLSRWQKIVGLMRDITVARSDVGDVAVVENGVREVMGSGLKIGLRVPWVCYVGRTVSLDRAFVVRRGVPALSFAVRGGRGALASVIVSTPDARALAEQLAPGRVPADGDGRLSEA